jgi:hypothetical protein
MTKISRKTGAALLALSLLGTFALARADDGLADWPQRVSALGAEQRAVKEVDQTIYRPAAQSTAGTPERAADDAFYYRQFGGVAPN